MLWAKMEYYYYRCVARMASFQSSFRSPTKVSIFLLQLVLSFACVCSFELQELSLGQVSRCQGYVSQLMGVVSEQRSLLSDSSVSSNALR